MHLVRSVFLSGCLLLQISSAYALQDFLYQRDELFRGETVISRQRPELDPLGVHWGSFFVYPGLRVEEQYSDNIFADDLNKVGDFITLIRPNLQVKSDWNNHSLRFGGAGNIGVYADNSDQNFEDYNFYLDSRFDISRTQDIVLRADYSQLHQRRRSPNDVNAGEPTIYDTQALLGRYSFQPNRLFTQLQGKVHFLDFDKNADNPGNTNGPRFINNDARDRTLIEGTARIGYEFKPEVRGFIEGGVNTRNYYKSDAFGVSRDSDGYHVVVGADIDFSGVTFGEIFIGYSAQDYDDPNLSNIDGLAYGASVTWNPTGLTTVTGKVTREVQESTLRQASGFFMTRGDITVDHELLRNLILSAKGAYEVNDFEGIDREDDYWEAGIGARYLMNRYMNVSLQYDFVNRDASGLDGINNSFTEHAGLLALEFNY